MCTIGDVSECALLALYISLGISPKVPFNLYQPVTTQLPKQSKGKPLPLPFFGRVCPVCSSWQRVSHYPKTWPDFSSVTAKSGTLPAFMTVASVKMMPTHKMPFNYND